MGLFDNLFTFHSKEEIERKDKALSKKVYPLGIEEKEWEDKMFKQLFSNEKHIDLKTLKFVAISLRQMKMNSLLDKDDENYQNYDEAYESFKTTLNSLNITKSQLDNINKLNDVMLKAKCIEDLKIGE